MSGSEPELALLRGAPTLKKCAACGAGFSCGAPAAGCWCEEVHVTAIVLLALRARYADCLCRRCLTAAAASASDSKLRAVDSDPEFGARGILP